MEHRTVVPSLDAAVGSAPLAEAPPSVASPDSHRHQSKPKTASHGENRTTGQQGPSIAVSSPHVGTVTVLSPSAGATDAASATAVPDDALVLWTQLVGFSAPGSGLQSRTAISSQVMEDGHVSGGNDDEEALQIRRLFTQTRSTSDDSQQQANADVAVAEGLPTELVTLQRGVVFAHAPPSWPWWPGAGARRSATAAALEPRGEKAARALMRSTLGTAAAAIARAVIAHDTATNSNATVNDVADNNDNDHVAQEEQDHAAEQNDRDVAEKEEAIVAALVREVERSLKAQKNTTDENTNAPGGGSSSNSPVVDPSKVAALFRSIVCGAGSNAVEVDALLTVARNTAVTTPTSTARNTANAADAPINASAQETVEMSAVPASDETHHGDELLGRHGGTGGGAAPDSAGEAAAWMRELLSAINDGATNSTNSTSSNSHVGWTTETATHPDSTSSSRFVEAVVKAPVSKLAFVIPGDGAAPGLLSKAKLQRTVQENAVARLLASPMTESITIVPPKSRVPVKMSQLIAETHRARGSVVDLDHVMDSDEKSAASVGGQTKTKGKGPMLFGDTAPFSSEDIAGQSKKSLRARQHALRGEAKMASTNAPPSTTAHATSKSSAVQGTEMPAHPSELFSPSVFLEQQQQQQEQEEEEKRARHGATGLNDDDDDGYHPKSLTTATTAHDEEAERQDERAKEFERQQKAEIDRERAVNAKREDGTVWLCVVDTAAFYSAGLPTALAHCLRVVQPYDSIVIHGAVWAPEAAESMQMTDVDWTQRRKDSISGAVRIVDDLKAQAVRILNSRPLGLGRGIQVGAVTSELALQDGVAAQTERFAPDVVVVAAECQRWPAAVRGPLERLTRAPYERLLHALPQQVFTIVP